MCKIENRLKEKCALRLAQHIRCGLTPLPFGTLLPTIATSYMLGTLYAIADNGIGGYEP